LTAWENHVHRARASQLALAAKAAADAGHAGDDERPRTPSRSQDGVQDDPLIAFQSILRQLREAGRLPEAVVMFRKFLAGADERTEEKSLFDPKLKGRLQDAFRDLQSGPAALEAARVQIRDKKMLQVLDVAIRRPSPGKRFLSELDETVKGGEG